MVVCNAGYSCGICWLDWQCRSDTHTVAEDLHEHLRSGLLLECQIPWGIAVSRQESSNEMRDKAPSMICREMLHQDSVYIIGGAARNDVLWNTEDTLHNEADNLQINDSIEFCTFLHYTNWSKNNIAVSSMDRYQHFLHLGLFSIIRNLGILRYWQCL